MRFFGFAVADSMFPVQCDVRRQPMSVDEVRASLDDIQFCLNPSHELTIQAARERFNLPIQVPDRAPVVKLNPGDEMIVMSVRGLPRLEGRHEYSADEIAAAEFQFGKWTVVE